MNAAARETVVENQVSRAVRQSNTEYSSGNSVDTTVTRPRDDNITPDVSIIALPSSREGNVTCRIDQLQ